MGLMSKGIERRARAEGLIGPTDTLLSVEAGDLNLWASGGEPTIPSRANCAVGYSADQLVIVGADRVAAVDLLMLFRVEVAAALGWLTITYLRDRDSYRTTFQWAMTRRREAAQFAAGLEAAAARRRTDFPEHVQQEVAIWGAELDRRISECMRLRDSLTGPIDITTSIPIGLQRLAFKETEAPIELPNFGERTGHFMLLADDTFALTANVGVVAHFARPEITHLAIRRNGPSLEPSAAWEVGYQSTAGQRHLFFEAPGLALWPGMADVGADSFLADAQLLDLLGHGASWLSKAPARSQTLETPDAAPLASFAPSAPPQPAQQPDLIHDYPPTRDQSRDGVTKSRRPSPKRRHR